jgi:N-acylneuraminate cytidylyltransferase/CMP-N,N'-diacetyllegionaminic acid synthase
MNTLFLITARGGSRGVPKKNICKIGGLPLLAYKAIAARKSNYCTRLIISTDSDEIAAVAREYGVEVPFMRPAELATDSANSMDVILHAMDWIEKNDPVKYDALCLLEPSTPFLTPNDVNQAIHLYQDKNALGVLGVKEVKDHSIFVSPIGDDLNMTWHYKKMWGNYHTPRQVLIPEYTMNGAIYLAAWDYLKEYHTFHSPRTYAYIMPEERSIEIDEVNDLYYASFLVEKGLININIWK